MTLPSGLAKASFKELAANFKETGSEPVEVQFNPESLKVSFSNQLNQGGKREDTAKDTPKDNSNSGAEQFVSNGTTKLALQLWFDVNAPLSDKKKNVSDVRDLTKDVAYFITPKDTTEGGIPPAVKFHWGSFTFEGLMESMEESLEFFSEDGVPLRASVSVTISQQKILKFKGNAQGAFPPGVVAPGKVTLAVAQTGSTLQAMADQHSLGGDWQSVAEANKIENPRLLAPGTLINFNLKAR